MKVIATRLMVLLSCMALAVIGVAAPAQAYATGCMDTAPKWSVEENVYVPLGIPPWADVAWFKMRINFCWDSNRSMYGYTATIPNDSTTLGAILGFDIDVVDPPHYRIKGPNFVDWSAQVRVRQCTSKEFNICSFTGYINVQGSTTWGPGNATKPLNHRTVSCGNLACSLALRLVKQ